MRKNHKQNSGGTMKHIVEKEFDDIINQDKMTVVEFFATWCMPCRMLKPIMEKIEASKKSITFCELDVEESEEIAKRYRIFSVPTVVCFRSGKKIDSIVGLNSHEEMLAFINRCDKTEV